MKIRTRILAVICAACLTLTGCSNNKVKIDIPEDAADAKGELSLYCMGDDAKVDIYISTFNSVYKNVKVTKTAFDDVEKMDELLKTELNAGKGPDVIVFPSGTSLDVLELSRKGAFTNLSDKIKAKPACFKKHLN